MKLLKLIPDNTNIDFMRWRKLAMILSILAVIGSWALVGTRGLNLGVDFIGGQMIRATFAQPVDVDQLRDRVNAVGVGDATIQESGGPRTYQIRLPKPEGGETAANRAASQVRTMLERQYPNVRIDSVESVSGRVSEELARDGSLAIGLAMLGVAIYIWFRFEWHFGVGALITLFHDVSVMAGFFSLSQLQVDLNIVAAFLAIVGYSLNDTVVIYDRIRENLRKFRKMAIVPMLNLSLNETLSRTAVTALSITFAMIGIALYIWFRFEWQFGVGALITLFHDVSMVLGFFAITQLPVDLNIVAAFLAIVGYSLNDTVVIYDRIRENLRKYRKMEIVSLLNFSLNETLSRTIVTSLSIMLALAVLLALGPDVLFGLTIAILLGTFIGTYSSIYISAPALVWMGLKPDSFLRTADEKDADTAVHPA